MMLVRFGKMAEARVTYRISCFRYSPPLILDHDPRLLQPLMLQVLENRCPEHLPETAIQFGMGHPCRFCKIIEIGRSIQIIEKQTPHFFDSVLLGRMHMPPSCSLSRNGF